MSAYEGGQNHLPDIPAERWREMYEEAAAELERLRADLARAEADRGEAITALRQERAAYAAHIAAATGLLTGIHSLMYPPPTTTPDGRVMVFRPTGLDPHAILQELSDRIRRVPEELAKLDAAIAAQGADHE